MGSPTQSWRLKRFTTLLILLCFSFSSPTDATSSKKLDQPPTDSEIKCGSCPCGQSCSQQDTPPSPSPPKHASAQSCNPLSPPLPLPLPLPPPPPPPQQPPPPPRFFYVTDVPGDVYQPIAYNWGDSAAQKRTAGMLMLAGLGALTVAMVFG